MLHWGAGVLKVLTILKSAQTFVCSALCSVGQLKFLCHLCFAVFTRCLIVVPKNTGNALEI